MTKDDKAGTAKRSSVPNPYDVGFLDGYQLGSNFYKPSMAIDCAFAEGSYRAGVADGQQARVAVWAYERERELRKKLVRALKAARISLIGDEHYQEFKPLLATINDAIAAAEEN